MAAESPQAQPVRRADALRSGTSDWALRRKHVALFRGIHVDATAPVTLLMRVEAALVVSSAGSYVSHHTAGRLWGGIVPDDPDIHVTSARSRTRRRGIAAHRAKKGQTVVLRHGFRTTAPSRPFSTSRSGWCSSTWWCSATRWSRPVGRRHPTSSPPRRP